MINGSEGEVMVEKSKKTLVFAFVILLIAVWLILFRSVWDFVARLLLASAVVLTVWGLLKKEKGRLNLAITLLALLGVAWLVWAENVSILHVLPLLVFAVLAVRWILRDEAKPARLLGFFIKTFTLFLIGTGFAYFIVWLGVVAPHTYSVYPVNALFEMGVVFIYPIALLLEAISIVVYGIFRIKLKPWEIFLSSWYVSIVGSIFLVFAMWMPRTPASPYSSLASAIGVFLGLLFGALLIAGIIAGITTIVYVTLKGPRGEPPP